MMTQEQKLAMLEDLMDLDAGTLTPETVLSDLDEWDSIARLSFISMLDDEFDKLVKGAVVKEKETVADLLALMVAE